MADNFLGHSIKAGATSQSILIQMRATTTHADLTGKVAADVTGSYLRQGSTRTAITMSDLAAVDSAYSSGGMKEIDATNMKGLYRVDVPDAALAAGVEWVCFSFQIAGSITIHEIYSLNTYANAVAALKALVIETAGSVTLGQAMSVILSAAAGVTSNAGATLKTPDGTATRITATINGSNERTAITLNPSA